MPVLVVLLACGSPEPAAAPSDLQIPAERPPPDPTCLEVVPVAEIEAAIGQRLVPRPLGVSGGPPWQCAAMWDVGAEPMMVSVTLDDQGYDFVAERTARGPGRGYAEVRQDVQLGDASVLGLAHAWTAEQWAEDRRSAEERAIAEVGAGDALGVVNRVGAFYTPSSHTLGVRVGRYQLHYEFDAALFTAGQVEALLPAIRSRLPR